MSFLLPCCVLSKRAEGKAQYAPARTLYDMARRANEKTKLAARPQIATESLVRFGLHLAESGSQGNFSTPDHQRVPALRRLSTICGS